MQSVNCYSCGNINPPGSTLCVRCGANLNTQQQNNFGQPQQQQPWQQQQQPWQQQQQPWQQPGYGRPPQPDSTPQDLGFLLLAILPAAETLLWKLLHFAGIGYSMPVRMFFLLFTAASWAIMIFYTRNKSYKIIVIVLAALMLLYRIYEEFSFGSLGDF